MRALIKIAMSLLILGLVVACGEELTDNQKLDRFRSLVQDGKYESAEKELRKLMIDFPTDSIVLYWGARMFYETENYDSAVSYSKKLTSLFYKHFEGYQLLRDAAEKSGDLENQLWAVSQLGYFVRDRRRYYNEIAELNFKQGNYGLTISTCNTILEYDPDNLRIMFLLASSLAAGGSMDTAIKVMERIDRLYPNQPEIQSNLGLYLIAVGRLDDAENTFLELIRAKPDFVPGWFGLGNLYLEKGDTTEALEAYRKVYEIDSTFLGVDSVLRQIDPTLLPDSSVNIESDFSD